jgi:hypothetical protein
MRVHFGFHSTGAHFIDFADIRLEPEERPDLYQRLVAFVADNFLRKDGGISHHDKQPEEDEELSPSLENLVVLAWLRLIHSDLPRLVKQRYETELRSRTLASIKLEISQALDTQFDEATSSANSMVMHAAASRAQTIPNRQHYRSTVSVQRRQNPRRECPLCKQAGRTSYQHFLSKCTYLPDGDRNFMTKASHIVALDQLELQLGHSFRHVIPKQRRGTHLYKTTE